MTELGRLLTAMVTPYTPEGEVDYAHARRLAAHLVRSGNDGVVSVGTTGESPLLTDDEKYRLWEEVKQELGRKDRRCRGWHKRYPPLHPPGAPGREGRC